MARSTFKGEVNLPPNKTLKPARNGKSGNGKAKVVNYDSDFNRIPQSFKRTMQLQNFIEKKDQSRPDSRALRTDTKKSGLSKLKIGKNEGLKNFEWRVNKAAQIELATASKSLTKKAVKRKSFFQQLQEKKRQKKGTKSGSESQGQGRADFIPFNFQVKEPPNLTKAPRQLKEHKISDSRVPQTRANTGAIIPDSISTAMGVSFLDRKSSPKQQKQTPTLLNPKRKRKLRDLSHSERLALERERKKLVDHYRSLRAAANAPKRRSLQLTTTYGSDAR